MTHFVYKPHWPGLPHREAMPQLEEFGTEVVPELLARMRLEAGQVAVVTGAASGIGRALAEGFSGAGWRSSPPTSRQWPWTRRSARWPPAAASSHR